MYLFTDSDLIGVIFVPTFTSFGSAAPWTFTKINNKTNQGWSRQWMNYHYKISVRMRQWKRRHVWTIHQKQMKRDFILPDKFIFFSLFLNSFIINDVHTIRRFWFSHYQHRRLAKHSDNSLLFFPTSSYSQSGMWYDWTSTIIFLPVSASINSIRPTSGISLFTLVVNFNATTSVVFIAQFQCIFKGSESIKSEMTKQMSSFFDHIMWDNEDLLKYLSCFFSV